MCRGGWHVASKYLLLPIRYIQRQESAEPARDLHLPISKAHTDAGGRAGIEEMHKKKKVT